MAENADDYTALDYAIMSGNLSLARELLAQGASTDEYVLYTAASSSKAVESTLLILNSNIVKNPEIRSQILADAFISLCEFDVGEEKIVRIIEALLDIEVPEPSIILNAAVFGRMDIVKLLLERTEIDHRTKMMFLHCAMCRNTSPLPPSSMARMLIEWGVDIEYSMYLEVEHFNRGMRPLHGACLYGSQENIQLLLHLGAEVNVRDDYGNTPFSFLIHDQLNEPCRLFIKHFALLSSKGDTVSQQDLECIASYPILQQFYDECLIELQRMMDKKFFNRITFHSIFTKNLKQLSMLMRRQKFVENFKSNLDSFSIYRHDLNQRFKEAEKRKDLLTPIVDALYEALDEILPHVPIEIIIQHLYYSDAEMSAGESILLDS